VVTNSKNTSLSDAFTQRELTPPKPTLKPYTPNYSPTSQESLDFQREHGVYPHDLADETKKLWLGLQQSPDNFENLKRPLARYGRDASKTILFPGILGTESMQEGTGFGGLTIPDIHDPNVGIIKRLVEDIGGEKEVNRLAENLVVLTDAAGRETLNHEYTHAALNRFQDEGFFGSSYFEWNVGLKEEDIVRLLDFISGEDVEGSEWWFKNGREKWREEPTSPEDLLDKEGVINILIAVQQQAAEELKKQNIDIPHSFGDVLK